MEPLFESLFKIMGYRPNDSFFSSASIVLPYIL